MESSMALKSKAPPLSSSTTKTSDINYSPEESSWTFYMQDFIFGTDEGNNNNNNNSSFSSDYGTSSLVSDAASSAAKKLAINQNDVVSFASERSNFDKLKRIRKLAKGVTDDLEDTASSPVNSPKVSYMNQMIMKQNEMNNKCVSDLNNQGHNSNSSHNQMSGLDINVEGGDNDSPELKKKGLCLVPLSVLANYFG